jgi:hypothetical protein
MHTIRTLYSRAIKAINGAEHRCQIFEREDLLRIAKQVHTVALKAATQANSTLLVQAIQTARSIGRRVRGAA